MNWDIIQNFSSNLVFGILLFAMVIYWISLSFFKWTKNLSQIGKISAIIANVLLFFILGYTFLYKYKTSIFHTKKHTNSTFLTLRNTLAYPVHI